MSPPTLSPAMQRLTLGLACVFLGACAATEPVEPRAVFMIIDGIPADVIERVDTPGIDAVSAAGGFTRAYVGGEVGGASESPTVSSVGYASLVTGTWANKHNVWSNDIEAPDYTYWDIFRVVKAHDPALEAAIFSTWRDNRTKLIGNGLAEAGGNKLDYYFDGLELDTERFPHDDDSNYIRQIDELVAADAARVIVAEGPDLSWVYLQYTDDIAHYYGDSDRLDAAVQFMDGLVDRVWQAVQQREAATGEDWLVVVTTDHGRDSETGMDHGGQTERERTIWIATNSDRLNARFDDYPGIVDILPSVATHLGIDIPDKVAANLDGQSFID